MRSLRRAAAAAAITLLGIVAMPAAASAAAEDVDVPQGFQKVLWVGNNWDGTATAVQASPPFKALKTINVVPDKAQRFRRINSDPLRYAVYLSIRLSVLGHDQYADDLYTTADGSHLVLSRPSFGDVVSINIATGKVDWRFEVGGWRADHMAVSGDRKRVAVSASLSNRVYVLDIETGKQLGQFPTGDRPHENYFSRDGKVIYNESIGNVFLDLDAPQWDFTKGTRRFTIADATTYKVLKTVNMNQKLRAFGRPEISPAMRPFSFTPDDRRVYFQSSFFHGYSVYDIEQDKIVKVVDLPTTAVTPKKREGYILDSAHHGLALSPTGDKVCVAGTVSDYATVVDDATNTPGPLVSGKKPYWATVSGDGRHCVVSLSGEDNVVFLNMDTGQEVARTRVGYHPQRVRIGIAPASWG